MFHKILIANRGEIACRVAATARRMGIKTVAVYSEADADALHVTLCDEAVPVGPAPARDSYLKGDAIIAAALATGAQAIHPGYGFLSENEDFARACAAAGLVFIGPPPSAMHAMASKSAAKTLMESAGVPLVPGYHGEAQDSALLLAEADRIGYPVLLKASAGGGGKGMRIVERSVDFVEALASCKREATSSFGDDKVLVEKYLQRPRHIEIQVFADTLGNCIYLFERDCSVQRRHQKVLEEAPAPGMTPERRAAMGEAAVAAAKTVGYVGAGTVEFIVNQDGSFYFMEMNTRLQVEHPVTEMISGTDLVEWQLRVADGEPLPLLQHQLEIHGHAIEARIYAENPDKGFLPSIGTLAHVRTPPAVNFTRSVDGAAATAPAPVRIDSGVRQGDAISPYYDPMIAKLIVWGADRAQALARMRDALAAYQVVGLATNIVFLQRLLESAAFSNAELDTGLIEQHRDTLFPAPKAAPAGVLALATAALLRSESGADGTSASASASEPWSLAAGWRMNGRLARRIDLVDATGDRHVTAHYLHDGWSLAIENEPRPRALALLPCAGTGADLAIRLDGQTLRGQVVREGDIFHVFTGGRHWTLAWHDPMAHAGVADAPAGALTAPMPGKIIAILANAGASVVKGAPLLVMEAMKMEHTICAPRDGTVAALLYQVGDQVGDGAQLLTLDPA